MQLEQLEQGLFRGESEHLGLPQVYGAKLSVNPYLQLAIQ
ncbi:acyl-CoA thioesterase II [Vibrio ishigakensis]|uniref:Acyl-CoA thioesterase II n=1 Tax=Vibrio ishigakensis TaxID=1481914 RepID=A0A0B8NSY6_9VIBR|nr:acyl-CoA thioesterase II [Vibrio ishigakensis]